MIYTLTFNPALDYVLDASGLSCGVNRAKNGHYIAGGKGINVSAVLTSLGAENTALCFAGGFVGEKLRSMLGESGITAEFFETLSDTRINVKLRTENGEVEINAEGADIPEDGLNRLMKRIEAFSQSDVLILAGSVPKSLSDTIYGDILRKCRARCIVDAAGGLLLKALEGRPFLIKPNNFELCECCGEKTDSISEAASAAGKLQMQGARNVLVSRGSDGALLLAENGAVYYADAPKGKALNTVGAGDSMLAGFVFELLKSGDYAEAMKTAVAAGSASAFSETLACAADVARLRANINVKVL